MLLVTSIEGKEKYQSGLPIFRYAGVPGWPCQTPQQITRRWCELMGGRHLAAALLSGCKGANLEVIGGDAVVRCIGIR